MNEAKKYAGLHAKLKSNPRGISRKELKWMAWYEDNHPLDPIVVRSSTAEITAEAIKNTEQESQQN